MTATRQELPLTKTPHFATLLVMALAPEEVGRRIATAREAKGWSNVQLAAAMGVDVRTVQRWQRGWDPRHKHSLLPRLTGPKGLVHLAEVLEVSSSYFVETDAPEPALEALRAEMAKLSEKIDRLVGSQNPQPRQGHGRSERTLSG